MIWPDEKYGGMWDNDFRYEQIIIEETARVGCLELYNTLHSRLVGPYFQRFGTAAQRERFLPCCVTGDGLELSVPSRTNEEGGTLPSSLVWRRRFRLCAARHDLLRLR